MQCECVCVSPVMDWQHVQVMQSAPAPCDPAQDKQVMKMDGWMEFLLTLQAYSIGCLPYGRWRSP